MNYTTRKARINKVDWNGKVHDIFDTVFTKRWEFIEKYNKDPKEILLSPKSYNTIRLEADKVNYGVLTDLLKPQLAGMEVRISNHLKDDQVVVFSPVKINTFKTDMLDSIMYAHLEMVS